MLNKWKLVLATLAGIGILVGGVVAVRAQPRTRVGYIQLYFVDVPFLAVCSGRQVSAGVNLHYESADDALAQLQVLFPQCEFQQIQIGPLPMPPAPPR